MTDPQALTDSLDLLITHPGFHHYETKSGYRFVWVDYTDNAERRTEPESGDEPILWCDEHKALVTEWKGRHNTLCLRFHELVDSRLTLGAEYKPPKRCRIEADLRGAA